MITGSGWSLFVENGIPYWYNMDTGEASYRTPLIIQEKERYATAVERGYGGIPLGIMVKIFSYLSPKPDRLRFSYILYHIPFSRIIFNMQ
jgi:hypothetical protein